MRAGAAVVPERDEGVVVRGHPRAPYVALAVDLPHRPQQPHRLVDQMAAEVVQQTSDFFGAARLAPAALGRRPPPLEA
jgi:hypothetical protein